jgi:uncharacterized membrane protein HdeD (DUF308 family)
VAIARDGGLSQVGGSWKRLVGLGTLIAILGLVALWNAVDASLVTAVLVGYLLVVSGVMHVFGAFAPGLSVGWRLVHLVIGIAWVLVGFNIAFNPLSGVVAVTVVLAIMLIAEGLTRIVAALMQRVEGWAWMLVVGIVDVLLGLWLWTGIPFTGVAIGIFVGVELLFAGLTMIAVGWSERSAQAS